ncbi:Store-operated calcium entry regulator STIMATE [Nymphon striatum]|nr:Store-operated calcium entry regulator STIMATE [Nymphon striatum]
MIAPPITQAEVQDLHCSRGALTDSFGWLIQGILAGLAFTSLIVKRSCEPKVGRRPWLIWFYDTSKQGVGALVIHFTNVFLAGLFHGDPCTWYIVSFLLDSSIGLLIIFIGIKVSQCFAIKKKWPDCVFGHYGDPPRLQAWLTQTIMYISIMIVEKILITILLTLSFWSDVRRFILSPIKNPRVELALVMLVIPFVINVMMFWVVDNFLMQHKKVKIKSKKVRYQRANDDSDSDIIISADEGINSTRRQSSSSYYPLLK